MGVPATDSQFDLNHDDWIDELDLRRWLEVAGPENGYAGSILPGDANLDGVVDASDLNVLGIHWQQAGRVWSDGDFSGDGVVDATDLNALGVPVVIK